MLTNLHVEAIDLELAVLLTESAALAPEVHAAIAAGALLEGVLLPHLGAVEARVAAAATHRAGYQRVQCSVHTTSCSDYTPPEENTMARINENILNDLSPVELNHSAPKNVQNFCLYW